MNAKPNYELAMLVRIEKLEKENVRLKRIGALILLIVSALLLMGQTKQSATPWQKQVLRVGTVQTNAIEVLPEGAKGVSPVPAVRISGSPPELTMFDQTGKARVHFNGILGDLQMGEIETDNSGGVHLFKPGSTVKLESLGGGSLVLNNPSGEETT